MAILRIECSFFYLLFLINSSATYPMNSAIAKRKRTRRYFLCDKSFFKMMFCFKFFSVSRKHNFRSKSPVLLAKRFRCDTLSFFVRFLSCQRNIIIASVLILLFSPNEPYALNNLLILITEQVPFCI